MCCNENYNIVIPFCLHHTMETSFLKRKIPKYFERIYILLHKQIIFEFFEKSMFLK